MSLAFRPKTAGSRCDGPRTVLEVLASFLPLNPGCLACPGRSTRERVTFKTELLSSPGGDGANWLVLQGVGADRRGVLAGNHPDQLPFLRLLCAKSAPAVRGAGGSFARLVFSLQWSGARAGDWVACMEDAGRRPAEAAARQGVEGGAMVRARAACFNADCKANPAVGLE